MGGPGQSIPENLLYTKEHEWTKVEGDHVIVGISDFAQNSLHEITFVELPEVGTAVEANSECGLVESMKASSDIFSPVSGEIIEVNSELENAPELVNEDPYGAGWMMKIKPSNLDKDLKALMDAKAYSDLIASL
ncbi:MAG: glycine cleavage system protein GcvH [Candidatus Thorarchaeota archaeon]|nr:glycine cleavage system protein GcvH [Candidatus Thorarchaeota archaeon]